MGMYYMWTTVGLLSEFHRQQWWLLVWILFHLLVHWSFLWRKDSC